MTRATYDIIETYGFIIGPNAAEEKLQPLDDLFAKHSEKYKLGEIEESMRKGMSYDGKLYGVPMQAQMFVMAYRKDVFDKNGLTPPTTFEEMKAAAKKIQDAGDMKYPIAFPWLATGDISTQYQAALNSLGKDFVDPETKKPQFESPESKKALEEMKVPAAVHGSPGHHLRPAQGAAADVQRHRRHRDHVLRAG